jgi:hypothetical protein
MMRITQAMQVYHFGRTSAMCLAPAAWRRLCARLRETKAPLA